MRRLLVAASLVLAACDKTDGPAAVGGGTLVAVPLPYLASYETWCAHLGKGVCKGDWEGHEPGTSALGPYRFVLVEYADPRDHEGAVRDVFFELVTPKGNAYFGLGRTRKGPVTTSVMVHEVVDCPGALELRTVFRTSPRFTQSDYHNANFIVAGPRGLGVVEVPLGKIVGDDTGKTSGAIGTAQWQSGKLSVKGAAIADGVWAITPPGASPNPEVH